MKPAAIACAGTSAPGAATDVIADTGKSIATLRARAALAGFTLGTVTETDGQSFYMLCRWGMSRPLSDLAAVALFLRQVAAPE